MSGFAGQGWLQLGELLMAFALSALIGAEREIRHKSAGLRTYTLVGVSAALIMLISKYGFDNVLVNDRVVLDPSRIAAQIVTGIGFIGGGLIFVRRDSVRGLTTAAIVWLTAAVGMACGAGLPILALAVTAAHFVIVFAFPVLARHLPRSRWEPVVVQVSYREGSDVLSDVLVHCTEAEFSISRLQVERAPGPDSNSNPTDVALTSSDSDDTADSTLAVEAVGSQAHPKEFSSRADIATVVLALQGTRSLAKLVARLSAIDGVLAVHGGKPADNPD